MNKFLNDRFAIEVRDFSNQLAEIEALSKIVAVRVAALSESALRLSVAALAQLTQEDPATVLKNATTWALQSGHPVSQVLTSWTSLAVANNGLTTGEILQAMQEKKAPGTG